MCIIAVIPKMINIKESVLENCFDANPDGAGIMYQREGKVMIDKGFMTWRSFIKAWNKIPNDVDRVIHFRIATSGKVEGGNCHPFPVSRDFNAMRKTKQYARMAVAHNGILSEYAPKEGMKCNYSDTMNFIKLVIDPLRSVINKPEIQEFIGKATSNKFAIMTPTDTYIIGDFNESEGCFFSNYSYIKRTYLFDSNIDYGYKYSYLLSFPTPNMKKEEQEELVNLLEEELEYDNCYIYDTLIDKDEIVFETWGLPKTKTIKGIKWSIISKPTYTFADRYDG